MKTVKPIRSDSGFDIGPDMFAKDPEQGIFYKGLQNEDRQKEHPKKYKNK